MPHTLDPASVAQDIQDQVRQDVRALGAPLRIVGLLANDDSAARVYASYIRKGCQRAGIGFEVRQVPRLRLEQEILRINQDPAIHGVLIFYPIFGVERDNYLKDLVDPHKDIEGLSNHWLRRLYANERTDAQGNQAILPCTPLAIVRLLRAAGAMSKGRPRGHTITIFNRSEVVGRPLASMLAHDGAQVFSFDEHGPLEVTPAGEVLESQLSRGEALARSSIVITGVPSRSFPLVDACELRPEALCLNFSTLRNFTQAAQEAARVYIPRVGPVTVAMVLRNAVRLYRNYHTDSTGGGHA
jgi:methylenetetrahydrofolate dehydrogenase (NADP+)/methenyltetrahydrofolate cyclohydrolase